MAYRVWKCQINPIKKITTRHYVLSAYVGLMDHECVTNRGSFEKGSAGKQCGRLFLTALQGLSRTIVERDIKIAFKQNKKKRE